MPAPDSFPADLEYVGFWARVLAAVIDSALLLVIITPVLYWLYGPRYFDGSAVTGAADVLLNWVFPAIAVVVFWVYRQATPGKMVIGARIVDATTGQPASKGQLIGRYFGYYVSMIPFFLGIFWVAFDARKQGWHDKLAGTVVVKSRH
ncbi:MAG TPA: RDD family protein [Burkholderiaceae bacterium]|nr:RDD family protein [Burkholderiaceae bacterium]